MGLLDSMLGQVLGGAQGGSGDLSGALGGLFGKDGGPEGLGGLVSKFEQAGLGDVIGSWIGKGENAPVSGGQLNDVLGSDAVSAIASKLGISPGMLLPMLATLLPSLIDRLTPHGKIPDEGVNTNEELLSSLSGL
ncbi:MAG: DUF937 domain-containing protein, partial [Comamonadaceae bacterium]